MNKSCEYCIRFNPQPQNITMPTVCSSCDDMSLFVPVSRQEPEEDRMDVIGSNGNDGLNYAHVMSAPQAHEDNAARYFQTQHEYGRHYRMTFNGVKLDPYRICKLYEITDPAHQHAIKKLLRAGKSIKSLRQDMEEVQMSIARMLEMMDEDDSALKAEALARG